MALQSAYSATFNGGPVDFDNTVTMPELDASGFPTSNPGPGLVWVDTGAGNVLKMGT